MPAATWLHVAVALVLAAAQGGRWAAYEPESAREAAAMVGGGGLVYAAVWLLASRPRLWRPVALLVALAGAGASLVFVTQYAPAADAPKVAWADALGRALSGPFPRLVDWAPFPNSVATVLEGLVLLAAGLALGHAAAPLRLVAAGAAAVMGVGLLVSASRGAWLAVIAGAGAWGLSRVVRLPRAARLTLGMAALATLAAAVFATASAGEPWWLSLAAGAGRQDRVDVFRHTVTLIRDVPFTGIGAGDQFAMALSRYALLIQVPFLTYSHNLWLDVWVEQGLAGLAAWSLLAAAVAVAAVAGERAGLGSGVRGAWAGLLAIGLHGLSDARQSVDAWTWWPCFALAGLLAARLSRAGVRVHGLAAWAPAASLAVVVVATGAARWPAAAAWSANLGAVAEARGDLSVGLDDEARGERRIEAREAYGRALALDPGQVTALRRLGALDVADGRIADGTSRLARAWGLDPSAFAARKAYGLALVWAGEVERAAALLGGIDGIVDELNTWSAWRESRGETALALHAARASLTLAPSQPQVAARVARLSGAPQAPGPAGGR